MKTSCSRQFGELRIDRDGQRQVGHGAAFVDRHLVGKLVHLANQEVSRVFVCGLGGGRTFRQGWDDKGFVPPAIVPGAGKGHFAVTLLPELGFFAPAHQREDSSRHHRNIGAADDFEQAQGVRHFFVAPLVSADDRDAQHFNLRETESARASVCMLLPPGPEQS